MKKIIIVLLFCFGSQLTWAQKPLINQNILGYSFTSKINKTTYTLGVSVPEDFNPNKKYPVFYILDGFYSSEIAHGAHRTLDIFKDIEDLIVVTISGPEKTSKEWLVNRWGDYTFTQDKHNDTAFEKTWDLPAHTLVSGAGDTFLRVIKEEIFPIIESNYPTNGKRGIMGHSLSGLYVANLIFKANDVFDCFGLNSPSLSFWNNNDILVEENKFFQKNIPLNKKIFLSFGEFESKTGIKNLKDIQQLLISHYPTIETNYVIFNEEKHTTVAPAMIARSMYYFYAKKKK